MARSNIYTTKYSDFGDIHIYFFMINLLSPYLLLTFFITEVEQSSRYLV